MMKRDVLIILDGAGDTTKIDGQTPWEYAKTPNMDWLAKRGVTGLMQTLYPDLPKGSIVAQLGILGFDPYKYYPHGRASCEALAIGINLQKNDIAFRANLSLVEKDILKSYNANYIKTENALLIINKINNILKDKYPNFELYNNSDFRNTLIVRNSSIKPKNLVCIEPHENIGVQLDPLSLIKTIDGNTSEDIQQLNNYLNEIAALIKNDDANIIIPWSASTALSLPEFKYGLNSKNAIIGHMDFLKGIAIASNMDFFLEGNGSWDTDYSAKAERLISLLEKDYGFVYCHINGPDEASHAGKSKEKIESIESIDSIIVEKVKSYFLSNPEQLGRLIITTDHYTNLIAIESKRHEAHSLHPVPFLVWNNNEHDNVNKFSEKDCKGGKYGDIPINHLSLLHILNDI